jgi:hypothetical protein
VLVLVSLAVASLPSFLVLFVVASRGPVLLLHCTVSYLAFSSL